MTYKMTTRRKLAIATWSSPREGNIYGKMTLNMRNALRYIAYLREKSGEKVTITHLVGKVIGLALEAAPDLNGRIVFGKYIPHKTVDVSFLAALEEGKDLAKVKIERINEKTVVQVAQEMRACAERLHQKEDKNFEKSKPILKILPTWLLRPVIWTIGYVTGALGFSVPALGLEAFPFGGCIVTSVGMLGLDEAYAPPTPFARVPVYFVVPTVRDKPVVVDGEIRIEPMMDLLGTIDHRFLDGYRAAILAHKMREAFDKPWILDGLKEAPWDLKIA